jgi:hypothetical protein
VAATSPALRRGVARVLNRVPSVKRRLKDALARSGALPSQASSMAVIPLPPDEASLSEEARCVLRDLVRERERVERAAQTAGR